MNEPLSIYKLTISYDGTRYSGWQIQPNATSIQTLLEKSLETALRCKIKVTGSGRTDGGVHATDQVAHFKCNKPVDLKKLQQSLNGLLPIDIRIKNIEQVADDFHARYSAKGKIYRYYVETSSVINPFQRLYSYHLPYPIDLNLLKQTLPLFIGTRDFTSFSNEPHKGSAAKNPVRTIHRLDFVETENGFYLEFEGNGFLYKMVRNIVGAILDVARGYIPISSIEEVFQAKDRKKASATAPAHGLFLFKVLYL